MLSHETLPLARGRQADRPDRGPSALPGDDSFPGTESRKQHQERGTGNHYPGTQPSFEIRVRHNEVMLRVGVRDPKGNAVWDLHQKPGTYLVREVVQDSESGQMPPLNAQVEIP